MNRAYAKTLLAAPVAAVALLVPAVAGATESGGAKYQPPPKKATVRNGKAIAPANAPDKVRKVIAAANKIVEKPYHWGGGHGSWDDSGYDCSGTVSFALKAAGLLKRPLDSGSFMRWGKRGPGQWFTIYTNPGHAYVVIAGLRLDTSSAGAGGGKGPRWRATGRPSAGYTIRHPRGF
jgi:cell wall-associated NlpC family hydrolase